MSTHPLPSHAAWIKSSYSNGDGGECVEWAPSYSPAGSVPVRDSKNPDGPALLFSADAWTGFIAALTASEFPTV